MVPAPRVASLAFAPGLPLRLSARRALRPHLLPSASPRPSTPSRRFALLSTAQAPPSAPSSSPSPSSVPLSAIPIPAAPTPVLTFQDAVLRLQKYWADQGCVLWRPSNTEVGAGTMNPSTFLRVLGPEPWAVAYEEPSVRPDDSRYGENPNRLQCHTQFQVIVKPAPACAQELVVGSYRALGIDVTKRDVRFVEDNWESPALGAWGLGWEVWLDGMEITQFTYFQQAGGEALGEVSVEVTYGLERIVMALQGVTHFKDIEYAPGVSYGEVLLQNEVEMSRYNMDDADVGRCKQWFDGYEAEAQQLLEKRLPIPAYSFLLKASHTFNILDSRGAVGVTERARYFQRMRNLAREAAKIWVERREELQFPMLAGNAAMDAAANVLSAGPGVAKSLQAQSGAVLGLGETEDLVFELGVEELPAGEVTRVAAQVEKLLNELLNDEGLSHGGIRVDATPRRIVANVSRLLTRQPDVSKKMRGPPLKAALGKDGEFSKAGAGFLRSKGLDLEKDADKIELDEDGGYMYATVETKGRDAAAVLADGIPKAVIAKISSVKTMRWNDTGVAFSRPIRWMLCLLGDVAVPFEYAGLASGATSRSLRGRDGFAIDSPVTSAAAHAGVLKENQVVVSREERAATICKRAAALAAEVCGVVPAEYLGSKDSGLLAEVIDLVENPLPLLGKFDDRFLDLPQDVLVTVMRKHQRYFPVVRKDNGKLMAAFITVVNGDADAVDMDAIRGGNEAVLRARYSDAAFFYNKDTEGKVLADFVAELDGLTFQEKLGSMFDKVQRVKKAVPAMCALIDGMDASGTASALQIAELYKADLGTSMVVEMTSLAGIMGRHYALKSGVVAPEVAEGIFEASLPRFSGDSLPKSKPGVAVAIADRLDSLASLFSVGLMPKSTADPFALRRSALGVVQTLIASGLSLDLRDAIATSPSATGEKVASQVLDFLTKRLEVFLGSEAGLRPDVIKAVLAVQDNAVDPCRAFAYCFALQASRGEEAQLVADACEANGRAVRLVKSVKASGEDKDCAAVDEDLFEKDVERELLFAIELAEREVAEVESGVESLVPRLRALASIKGAVDGFCDGVFVAAEDESVRANRIALLRRVVELTRGTVDLSLLQIE